MSLNIEFKKNGFLVKSGDLYEQYIIYDKICYVNKEIDKLEGNNEYNLIIHISFSDQDCISLVYGDIYYSKKEDLEKYSDIISKWNYDFDDIINKIDEHSKRIVDTYGRLV